MAPREETRCAEGPGRAWSAWLDACHRYLALFGPWQYQSTVTGWVLPGIAPSRYPPNTPPRVLPLPYTADATLLVHGALAVTGV